MPVLLHLDTSPLAGSVTRELTREFVNAWTANHPGGTVIYRDLAANPLRPLDAAWVGAAYTPEADRTPEQKRVLAVSEELIGELEKADEFVIGVAMHNFSIPSVLKLWIDQVVRRNRTFSYGEKGPQGLLGGKKATILSATGGVYEVGPPAGAFNFVEPYLKNMLEFLGVSNVQFVTAGGVAQVMTGAVDRATFLKPTLEAVRTAAA
jgi:FMN-dependent NADH-azoreductase